MVFDEARSKASNHELNRPTRSDPGISPLYRLPEYFPPATIITAEMDSLAREATALAEKLSKAGKNVVLWEAKGQGHGWDHEAKENTEPAKVKWKAYELARDRLREAYNSP